MKILQLLLKPVIWLMELIIRLWYGRDWRELPPTKDESWKYGALFGDC